MTAPPLGPDPYAATPAPLPWWRTQARRHISPVLDLAIVRIGETLIGRASNNR